MQRGRLTIECVLVHHVDILPTELSTDNVNIVYLRSIADSLVLGRG